MPLAPLLSTVREHLIGQNLNVQLVGDGEAITVNMDLKHLRILLAFAVQGKSRLVQIEAFLPVRIPEGRRPAVVDFLSRVNWSIRNGRFVIDLDDGEVRFRQETAHQDEARVLSKVEEQMLLGCLIVDSFFPALMEVVFGGKDPKVAVEQAEAAATAAREERRSREDDEESTEDSDVAEPFESSEDAGEDDEVEDSDEPKGPKVSAESLPATSPAPVTTARQVLAAWVPKCPARPVYEEDGMLFYYEHGYRIYLSEPDAQAVRERVRHEGSSTGGEISSP